MVHIPFVASTFTSPSSHRYVVHRTLSTRVLRRAMCACGGGGGGGMSGAVAWWRYADRIGSPHIRAAHAVDACAPSDCVCAAVAAAAATLRQYFLLTFNLYDDADDEAH